MPCFCSFFLFIYSTQVFWHLFIIEYVFDAKMNDMKNETCCKHESYAMLDVHHTQTHCSRINNDLLRLVKNWIVTFNLWSIIDSEKHNKMTAYSYSMHSFIDENRLHIPYMCYVCGRATVRKSKLKMAIFQFYVYVLFYEIETSLH